MQIFAPYTNNVKRTSNRNKENVYGGRFRLDGKLMVAGGDSGLVQVFPYSVVVWFFQSSIFVLELFFNNNNGNKFG